jgi:hypothetical protein
MEVYPMRINIFLYILLSFSSLFCCCIVESSETKNNALSILDANNIDKKQIIDLEINLDKEKKLQNEVDNGHQPWRLEPIDVAGAALIEIDKSVDISNCVLISSMEQDAKVKCKGKNTYFVNLKRLTKPFGIWTAMSITVAEREE